MDEKSKAFCVDVATDLYRKGFLAWLNGEEMSDRPAESEKVGYKSAKKMYPDR